jgi:hypothetical protein
LLREPSSLIVDSSRSIEWVYVIDLDRELFRVSKHSGFCLSNLPKDLEEALPDLPEALLDLTVLHRFSPAVQARLTWGTENFDQTGVARASGRENVISPSNGQGDDGSAYFDLRPSIVVPRWSRVLHQCPITSVARHTLDALLGEHSQYFSQAQYTAPHDDDFIFREAAFIMLCICSCTPELLRITTRTQQTQKSMEAPFAMFKPSDNSINGPEFASAAFSGYHLRQLPGSSPASRSYWLLGVFVYLTRDLSSEKSIQRAIADMANCRRLEGSKHFNAILTSITHTILVRVTEDGVQHTKRLRVLDENLSSENDAEKRSHDSNAEAKGHHREEEMNKDGLGSEKRDDVTSLGELRMKWDETEPVDVLNAIAQVFEATAREK